MCALHAHACAPAVWCTTSFLTVDHGPNVDSHSGPARLKVTICQGSRSHGTGDWDTQSEGREGRQCGCAVPAGAEAVHVRPVCVSVLPAACPAVSPGQTRCNANPDRLDSGDELRRGRAGGAPTTGSASLQEGEETAEPRSLPGEAPREVCRLPTTRQTCRHLDLGPPGLRHREKPTTFVIRRVRGRDAQRTRPAARFPARPHAAGKLMSWV